MENKSLKALEKSLNFFCAKKGLNPVLDMCTNIPTQRNRCLLRVCKCKAHLEYVQLPYRIFETKLRGSEESRGCKGDVTREDSQRQFSATHHCNVGIMLYLVTTMLQQCVALKFVVANHLM